MPLRAYLAELIGTFYLVFGGTSAILGVSLARNAGALDAAVTVSAFGAGNVVIPFAFGLSLVVAVFALGHLCGAHFNPAVTLAFATARRFPWSDVPGYVGAQLLGGILASGVLVVCFGDAVGFTTGPTVPGDLASNPVLATFVFEMLATALLMLVIAAVATDARIEGVPAGLAIGFTVAAMAFATGWVGGGSFNPARSFGPALLGNVWTAHWVYWLAPIAGAQLGIGLYAVVRRHGPSEEPAPVMRDTTRN